jgi:hypothetical protein
MINQNSTKVKNGEPKVKYGQPKSSMVIQSHVQPKFKHGLPKLAKLNYSQPKSTIATKVNYSFKMEVNQ